MSIATNLYNTTEEITLVEVYVNGNLIGICEESQVVNLIEKINK